MATQCELILEHLRRGNGITTLQAMNPPFNCCRLSERIRELERDGWLCEHKRIKAGKKHIVRYTLIGKFPEQKELVFAMEETARQVRELREYAASRE